MFDAYTVRKAVPRILLAVIGINVSIYLCVAAVEITTIIGRGISDLLVSGFHADQVSIDGKTLQDNGVLSAGFLAALVILAFKSVGIVTALVGSLMPLILIVVLIALAVLFTLIIRQALIIFLTVVSPVAIACFVLPGTEKYFKKWFDLFVKTLMVYPIIAVIFAMSTVMGSILLRDASNATASSDVLHNTASLVAIHNIGALGTGGESEQAIKVIAAIIVIYAPLVLIPFAFKLAGGAISAVMNAASGATERRRRELGDNRRKSLGEARAAKAERIAKGQLYKGGTQNNLRGRINRFAQNAALVRSGGAGINPMRMQSRLQSSRGTAEFEASQKAKESASVKSILANDTLMNAALAGDMSEASARDYLVGQGQTGRVLEQNVALIRQARREVGARSLEIASAAALPGTKTAFAGEHGDVEMLETAMRAARGDSVLAGQIYNEQRGNASNAGRFDLAGYGFGTGLSAMSTMQAAYATGDQDQIRSAREAASESLQEDALTHLTGGQIVGGHGNSVNRMLRQANRRVDRAAEEVRAARGTNNAAAIAEAERHYKQVMGLSGNLLDMANAVGGENSIMLANSHMNHTVDLGTGEAIRVSEALELLRPDQVFQQSRRELVSSATPEQIAEARRRGQNIDPLQTGGQDATRPPY